MHINNTLILFSGGKDSFLTACRCIERGDRVGLIAFNNGCIAGEQCISGNAQRLSNRYGEKTVHYVGIYNTSSIVSRLSEWWAETPYRELANNFPELDNIQVTCLHCQTAMWISAIAYAMAKGYTVICAGYRRDDVFCTGSSIYVESMRQIASSFNIKLEVPVWSDGESGIPWEVFRDLELQNFGFYPVFLEPQCMMGRPVVHSIHGLEKGMGAYFSQILEPIVKQQIPRLREIFRHIKLSSISTNVASCHIPNGNMGFY